MAIVSSTVDAGGDLQLTVPGGKIYLGARPPSRPWRSKRSSEFQPSTAWGIRGKDYREESIVSSKSGMFMTTTINKGSIDETVVPTLLTAEGNLAIVTRDGMVVDYKD